MESETNLEGLAVLVTEHRGERKRGPYPATVWDSISALRKRHTVEEISRAVGIATTQIYRKTGTKRRPQFREVKLVPPQPAAKSVAVELRRVDGAELRLRMEATPQELSAVFAEFLR